MGYPYVIKVDVDPKYHLDIDLMIEKMEKVITEEIGPCRVEYVFPENDPGIVHFCPKYPLKHLEFHMIVPDEELPEDLRED